MKKSTAKIDVVASEGRVGLRALRPRLGHYVRQVAYGNVELIVCDNGTPLCRIVPVVSASREGEAQ